MRTARHARMVRASTRGRNHRLRGSLPHRGVADPMASWLGAALPILRGPPPAPPPRSPGAMQPIAAQLAGAIPWEEIARRGGARRRTKLPLPKPTGRTMNRTLTRRIALALIAMLGLGIAGLPRPPGAQAAAKVPRVGILTPGTASTTQELF